MMWGSYVWISWSIAIVDLGSHSCNDFTSSRHSLSFILFLRRSNKALCLKEGITANVGSVSARGVGHALAVHNASSPPWHYRTDARRMVVGDGSIPHIFSWPYHLLNPGDCMISPSVRLEKRRERLC